MLSLLALIITAPLNLAFNGDCELSAPAGAPPPGWAMWGPQADKDAANYTRDPGNPHSGEASLRVHQPAGGRGYLVTDPAHALRPLANQRLRVRLWLRADRERTASISLTAYRSINPYIDAAPPAAWRADVGIDWRPFEFSVTEGLDFFAGEAAFLLVTVKPGASANEAATLWVDDLEVTSEPADPTQRLLDPREFELPPPPSALTPGDTLTVRIDLAGAPIQRTKRDVGGISFHRLVGWTGQPFDREGNYTLDSRLERAIADLRLPMTRFYGVADEAFPIEAALDRAADLCRRLGLRPERVILELEDQSANRRQPPEVWARAAAHSEARGYGFRAWEVGNEVYSGLWDAADMGRAYATAADYANQVIEVSSAVRAVQPNARIGLSVYPGNLAWSSGVMKAAVGSYDFLCPHLYTHVRADQISPEDLVVTENQRQLAAARSLLSLAQAYNPQRDVVIDDTEWGLHCTDESHPRADDVASNAGILGVLHRAVRMIGYFDVDGLVGASSWQMLSAVASPGFGILSQQTPEQRFMLYWLYYYFNRAVLDRRATVSGTAPWYGQGELSGPLTPLLVTVSDDGQRAAAVVVNAGATSQPWRAELTSGQWQVSDALSLAAALDAPPLLADKADLVRPLAMDFDGQRLRCELPARSVSFVWLGR